jgi:hypothetical protein
MIVKTSEINSSVIMLISVNRNLQVDLLLLEINFTYARIEMI